MTLLEINTIAQRVYSPKQLSNLATNVTKLQKQQFSIPKMAGFSSTKPNEIVNDEYVVLGCNIRGDRINVIDLSDNGVYTMDTMRLGQIMFC